MLAVISCVFTLVFENIVFLGTDIPSCLCWMGALFLDFCKFCFYLWLLGERSGCV